MHSPLERLRGGLAYRGHKLRVIAADRIAAMRANRLVSEWIVPVEQPLVWIFQPPRSGGTMLLRLFDGHPQVHVWPRPANPMRAEFDLTRYNGRGFRKGATNREHVPTPIYFDPGWYKAISQTHTALTAGFNAWRNYQNLYGDKRCVMVHTAPPAGAPIGEQIECFRRDFPQGRILFIARNPADWLASAVKLEHSNRYTGDLERAAKDYCAWYGAFVEFLPADAMVLEFDRLVRNYRDELGALCKKLGLNWSGTLETTTLNGVPVPQNSAHAVEPCYAPDPAVLGHGKALRDVHDLSEAEELFRAITGATTQTL